MKKTLLIIITAGLFIACSSQSPEEVARNYAENIAKGDIREAKKYVTKLTEELLLSITETTAIESIPDFKFNFVRDSIAGNEAWVTYTDQKNTEGTILLTKVNGKWKVHF
jgi:hypothetical protein